MAMYPVPSPASVIHCPVHLCAVALGEDGRIASTCPECIAEAAAAWWPLAVDRRLALAAA